MKNLEFYNKKTGELYKFSKINIFFAPNNNGKTTFLNYLQDNFKNNFDLVVNGEKNKKNMYSLLSINSSSSIKDNLKLTNKNQLKIYLENKLNEDKLKKLKENIQMNLVNIQEEINDYFESMNLKYEMVNSEDITSFIISNSKIDAIGGDSTLRKTLFSLSSNSFGDKTIVFIDDFDFLYDEENTLLFLENTLNDEYIYFLTSSNAKSFTLHDDIELFYLNKNKILNIKESLMKIFHYSEDSKSLNEYLVCEHYDKVYYNRFLKNKILPHIQYTIGRMLTTKNFEIANKYSPELTKIIIPYNSDYEYKLLIELKKLLNKY